MGKTPDMPEPVKRSAPVTPESEEVQAAGQRQLTEMREKQGRGSTFYTNPAMKTGFSGAQYGSNTGSV